ncbi:MAG: ABC transporter permease [Betaproteobacteria bacterium]|nr:ABC transporter permease [Betaproteobacteria bacterium]
MVTEEAPAPVSAWRRAGGQWLLTLAGDWRGRAQAWPATPADLPRDAVVAVDAAGVQSWDIAFAARLWDLEHELRERGVRLALETADTAGSPDAAPSATALPEGLREVLALASPQRAVLGADAAAAASAPPAPAAPRPRLRITLPRTSPAVVTVAFFGEVLLAFGRWASGRAGVRGAEVLHQLDETGPRSLPIVALTCALVGLMLAYMGGAQLERIASQGYIAEIVTVGMVRELAGLMTGVILAGRIGSAFAAQLATMKAGEEIDALRVLGVDPIAHLVLPRLVALLLMTPALYACGVVAGIVAGWFAASGSYGVGTLEYFWQSTRAITFTHLSIGLFKAMLYVALIALAGCREGLHAGRSAQAVGDATTTAVVKALVWMVVAACVTTVVFSLLGY